MPRTIDFKPNNDDVEADMSWLIPDLTVSASSMYSSQSEFDRLAADFPLIYKSCEGNEFDLSLGYLKQTEPRGENKAKCFADHCEPRDESFNSVCESDEESVISAMTTPYLSRSSTLCSTTSPETVRKHATTYPTPRTSTEACKTGVKVELHAKGALFIQLTQLKTGCVKMAAQKIVHAQQNQTQPCSDDDEWKGGPVAEVLWQSASSFDSDNESLQSSCQSKVEFSHESPSRFASRSNLGSRTVSV